MKILIADDEPIARRTLEASLRRWGHEVVIAKDGTETTKILEQSDAPQLLLLDWQMPGRDGIEICRDLRRRNAEPYTYIVMLTSKTQKCDIIEALEGGADDFISKPFDPQELRTRLSTGERILTLMDQLVKTRESLREASLRDGLTGLWNRTGILDILDLEVHRARREESQVGIVLVDLDHFKKVNDTYGHLIGDEALRATSRTIRESVRIYDFAGRYGGEELLVVLPGCNQNEATHLAERLREALARITLPTSKGELRLTASFGVTVADRDTPLDYLRAVATADEALYFAKHQGRNRVEFIAQKKSARADLPMMIDD